MANMRAVTEAHIGDTLSSRGTTVEPLVGFQPPRPMVYSGVYPMDQSLHLNLRNAMEKLALNDPAVSVTTDSRCAYVDKFHRAAEK